MAVKNPVCIYGGVLKELQSGDSLPSTSGSGYPCWQILSTETVTVLDRMEYAIVSGVLDNQGTISLGDNSILTVKA